MLPAKLIICFPSETPNSIHRMNPFSFLFLLAAVLLTAAAPPPSAAQSDLAADRAALVALSRAVGGRSLLWNLSDSPCNWAGVTCSSDEDGSRVVALRLPAMGLSGELPIGLGNLTRLLTLSLRFNTITGSIPADVAKLGSLRNLYLQGNLISGEIPAFLYGMKNLKRVDLADNRFTGSISSGFNNLTGLRTLYLERNRLSGPIPDIYAPPLDQFNVSFNNLTGPIPDALSNKPAAAFEGNSLLCGRPLADCNNGGKKLSGGAVTGIVIGCVFGFLLILIVLFLLCRKNRKRTENPSAAAANRKGIEDPSPAAARKNLVFFGKTERNFNLEDLLRASAEVLGKGTFGTTYKATLDLGFPMAVKRLKDVTVSEKEFRERIESVGQMADHENLVPLKAYYFSRDEQLLVYEFMAMGSLSALLHGNRGAGRTPLNWDTRSTIALGAARGITNLHSQTPAISHGNIKSSNILISKSCEARVSDFGLNQIATPTRIDGYRAPEVTDPHNVSHKADVYSFGVLILELLTGKAPVEEGVVVDLPRWVQSVSKEEVFDLELLRYQDDEEDEMVRMLELGVECCGQHPDTRPSMAEVCRRIEEVCRFSGSSQDGEIGDEGSGSGLGQIYSVDSEAPRLESS
ncbi:Probable inactive receptor kinase At1g48480 [Linum perenne]